MVVIKKIIIFIGLCMAGILQCAQAGPTSPKGFLLHSKSCEERAEGHGAAASYHDIEKDIMISRERREAKIRELELRSTRDKTWREVSRFRVPLYAAFDFFPLNKKDFGLPNENNAMSWDMWAFRQTALRDLYRLHNNQFLQPSMDHVLAEKNIFPEARAEFLIAMNIVFDHYKKPFVTR